MLKHREGFTLIELLIVVVIIGILAAIAIPKFGATREKAYVSAMKSDLRNLQSAEEIYYSNGGYVYKATATLQPQTNDTDLDFATSEGVTISIVSVAGGYQATASHAAVSTACFVTVGDAAQGITCST